MKSIQKSSLGFLIPVFVYSTVTEGDQAAGKVDAILDEANNNLYYRGAAVEARQLIAEAVESITGVKRETVPVMKEITGEDGTKRQEQAKEADGTLVVEFALNEADYVKLALAKANEGKGVAKEAIAAQVAAFVANANGGKGISVDIKAPERKAGKPPVLAQKYVDMATKAITEGKADSFAKKYKKITGKDLTSTTDATIIGWAIKEAVEVQAAAAAASLTA